MRILLCSQVDRAWTTAFTTGPHTYLAPAPDLRDADVDVVVLQREREIDLVEHWLGRRPGRDVPAVFVEHHPPHSAVPTDRHPLAARTDIPIVHVTHFNEIFWDCGRAPTTVIEHAVVDPGYQYTGELPAIGVAIDAPVSRLTGTDLLPRIAGGHQADVFGSGLDGLPAALHAEPPAWLRVYQGLAPTVLHHQLARRRVYLHPFRWTSLGTPLIEAMYLGMPVVALAATAVVDAVPAHAGVLSTNPRVLADAVYAFLADRERARHAGRAARKVATERYSLDRFHHEWDAVLTGLT